MSEDIVMATTENRATCPILSPQEERHTEIEECYRVMAFENAASATVAERRFKRRVEARTRPWRQPLTSLCGRNDHGP